MRDGGPGLDRRADPAGPQRSAALGIDRHLLCVRPARADASPKDDKIGHVTDFHGKVLEQIRAPFDAEILYVIGTPPITKGEPVAMVATKK